MDAPGVILVLLDLAIEVAGLLLTLLNLVEDPVKIAGDLIDPGDSTVFTCLRDC